MNITLSMEISSRCVGDEGPPHPALDININDIGMSCYVLDWNKF